MALKDFHGIHIPAFGIHIPAVGAPEQDAVDAVRIGMLVRSCRRCVRCDSQPLDLTHQCQFYTAD